MFEQVAPKVGRRCWSTGSRLPVIGGFAGFFDLRAKSGRWLPGEEAQAIGAAHVAVRTFRHCDSCVHPCLRGEVNFFQLTADSVIFTFAVMQDELQREVGATTATAAVVDPTLSANIYATGMLDAVVAEILLPFRNDLACSMSSKDTVFWIMRYPCRGDHIKIRVHGSGSDTQLLRGMLEPHIQAFLKRTLAQADTRASSANAGRGPQKIAPPIDDEDRIDGQAQDPSLIWTRYRRTAISLPPDPWLSDDVFARHFYKCLSSGCASWLQTISSTGATQKDRYSILSQLVCAAQEAAAVSFVDHGKSFSAYHRGWLLRFFSADQQQEDKIVDSFDRHLAASPSSRFAFRNHLTESSQSLNQPSGVLQWSRDVSALMAYVASFREDRRYQIDPFTDEVSYPVFFKLLHGVANQIGMTPREEAFVHHALYLASQEAA